MNVKRLFMLLLVAAMLLVTPLDAQAASYGTCYYLNGYAAQPTDTQTLTSLFGYLPCGSYWIQDGYLWQMNKYGYWQRVDLVDQQTPVDPSQKITANGSGYASTYPNGCSYIYLPNVDYSYVSCP